MKREEFVRIFGGVIVFLVILLGGFAVIQVLRNSPVWSDDGAAWVQAIGSIVAIMGAYHLAQLGQKNAVAAAKVALEDRHQALAYAHVVQLTEFLVSEASFAKTLAPMKDLLIANANGYPLEHVFCIDYEENLKEMGDSERGSQVGLIKPLVGMIKAYMKDFQLTPEKLADLPRKVIYQYNLHQIEARRVSSVLDGLLNGIENRSMNLQAETLIQAFAAYRAHMSAVRELHSSFAEIAGLDEAEKEQLFHRSITRQFREIDRFTKDAELLKRIRIQREGPDVNAA